MSSPVIARVVFAGLLGTAAACATAPPSATSSSQEPVVGAEGQAAACAAVDLPETVLGERVSALLSAVDSGDESVVRAMVERNMVVDSGQQSSVDADVARAMRMHELSGGLTVCRVEYVSNSELIALAAARKDGTIVSLGVFFEQQAPHRIEDIQVRRAPDEALTTETAALTAERRASLVDGVGDVLVKAYIFEDVGKAMKERVVRELRAGRYDSIGHPVALASALTRDLRAVSRDGHLRVIHSYSPVPADQPLDAEMTPEEIEQVKAQAARHQFGFARSEVWEGNIGYVDIRGFLPLEVARDAAAEAMSKIADCDAVIIDLRQNGGGDPAMVAFVTSYLFGSEPVHLNDLYYRVTGETERYHTEASVPGKRYGKDKPVYVLTSDYTFSGGEEFAYNLKNLGRATLIGETTGGGAHPVHRYRVDQHLAVIVPIGRAINPITKTNWEGTGVKPDIELRAADALDRAKALIAKPATSPESS